MSDTKAEERLSDLRKARDEADADFKEIATEWKQINLRYHIAKLEVELADAILAAETPPQF